MFAYWVRVISAKWLSKPCFTSMTDHHLESSASAHPRITGIKAEKNQFAMSFCLSHPFFVAIGAVKMGNLDLLAFLIGFNAAEVRKCSIVGSSQPLTLGARRWPNGRRKSALKQVPFASGCLDSAILHTCAALSS